MSAFPYRHLFLFNGPMCGGGGIHRNKSFTDFPALLMAKTSMLLSFHLSGFEGDENDDQNYSTDKPDDI